MELSIIGLGAQPNDVSLGAWEKILKADTVILRTEKTLSSQFLKERNINFVSLDGVYEKSRNFDTLSKNLAKEVAAHLSLGSVCYLVDGAVSEDRSAKILLEKFKDATVFEGVSKAQATLCACNVFSQSYTAFSAYDYDELREFSFPLVIYDLDSVFLASEWKERLSQKLGEEQKVWLYVDKRPISVQIYEIDRFSNYDYFTALVVEKTELIKKQRFDFDDLYDIVKVLRAPGGCPWDRVQTKESIRKNLIEECYELADAIDKNDDDKMLEEIGDVMLQAVFHMIFAEERDAFLPSDVFTDECKKLIFRHSHVFGTDKAANADSALENWDKNKQIEKGFSSPKDYVSDVPKCFPSLMRAQKVIKRISKYAVNQPSKEELVKFLQSSFDIGDENAEKKTEVCGDILLAACYYLKMQDVDAEEVLYFAVTRLEEAFKKQEKSFDFEAYFSKEKV